MPSSQIDAAELTTYDVDPQGNFVRLHLRDHNGQTGTVVLPTDCLTQLLMSLPGMVQKALRNRHGDDSLRLAHPLESFDVEVGETSASGLLNTSLRSAPRAASLYRSPVRTRI